MENNEISKSNSNSNRIKIIVITALIFLVSIAGVTYAYFSIQVSGNEEASSIRVSTALLRLIYRDTLVMEGRRIYPGWSQSKTISVENDGTDTVYYTIIWRDLLNEVTNNELLLSMICSSNIQGNTCEGLSSTPIPLSLTTTHNINIKKNIKIEPGETHTYTVTVVFPELSTSQNYNQGKTFRGTLNIAEGTIPKPFESVGTDETKGFLVVRSTSTPSEEFYVISDTTHNGINYSSLDPSFLELINYDPSKTILLAKYSLNKTTGLQTSSITITDYEVKFSATKYWYDSTTQRIKSDYGTTWDTNNIYDITYWGASIPANTVAYYVENYVSSLGVNATGRLLTYPEANAMENNQRRNNQSYWLGSAKDHQFVWYVANGGVRAVMYDKTNYNGVRPVIVVSASDIGA